MVALRARLNIPGVTCQIERRVPPPPDGGRCTPRSFPLAASARRPHLDMESLLEQAVFYIPDHTGFAARAASGLPQVPFVKQVANSLEQEAPCSQHEGMREQQTWYDRQGLKWWAALSRPTSFLPKFGSSISCPNGKAVLDHYLANSSSLGCIDVLLSQHEHVLHHQVLARRSEDIAMSWRMQAGAVRGLLDCWFRLFGTAPRLCGL